MGYFAPSKAQTRAISIYESSILRSVYVFSLKPSHETTHAAKADTRPSHPRNGVDRLVSAPSTGSISDPHQQHLLRGHDMEISALAVSPSGSLIATGDYVDLR